MLFSTYTFLFQFLPATVLAFAAARRHSPRAGIMVLAGASLFFYGAWRPVYLLLLIASIGVNFALGLRMEDPLRRRATGTLGVALNLALLCYFKYTNFIFDSLNTLTGAPLPFVNIILPLGISFFTFQQIAYLVDVMRGAKVERDIVSYTLFVSFFPHLIAGPLVHHAEMIPQFKRGRTGRSALLAARGLAIFAAGLFKKVVVADNLAQFVSPVFAHLDAGGGVTTEWAWLATLAYTLQIYFDFSGYSDMAIGLALSGDLDHRILAALAHHAVALPARLPLYSARGQPARRAAALSELVGDDAARRALAWRGLEFPDLGRPARHLSQHQSSLARLARRQTGGPHDRADSERLWLGRHLLRRRDRLGVLSRQDGGGGMANVAGPVRSRGRQLRLRILRHSAADGFADPGGGGAVVADRRRRGRVGARPFPLPAQCPAAVSLPRISPGAGAGGIGAMAAECGMGAGDWNCAGGLAVRHVAAVGIFVFPVLSASLAILQIVRDASISTASSLEPGRDLHDFDVFADRALAFGAHAGRLSGPLRAASLG